MRSVNGIQIILDFIHEMNATSGANAKKDILQKHLGGESADIIELLYKIAFDSRYQTFIAQIPEGLPTTDICPWNKFVDLSERVLNGERLKKTDWAEFITLVESHDNKKTLHEIITKSLTVGAGISTYNKVAQALGREELFEHEEMKVSNLEDATLNYDQGVFCGIKYDGANGSYTEDGLLKSRNGSVIFLSHMEEILSCVLEDGYVICGELYNKESRQSGNGLVNSAITKGYDTKLPIHMLDFAVFDAIPVADYKAGLCLIPYEDRIKTAEELVAKINNPKVHIVEQVIVYSKAEAYAEYRKARENENELGYKEGIILNDKDAPYEAKRSKRRARIKDKHTADVIIKDYKLHSKNDQLIGSVLVETGDGLISTWVGSGFKDTTMKEFFEKKDVNLIGSLIEIEYNHIIKGQDVKTEYSFYLPVFKRERIDKNDASTFDILDGKVL